MLSLSDNNQADVSEAFNTTLRYLDNLLNFDNPFFEKMAGQTYPTELHLSRTNGILNLKFILDGMNVILKLFPIS